MSPDLAPFTVALAELHDPYALLRGATMPLLAFTRPADRWVFVDDRPHVRRPNADIFTPVAAPSLPSCLALDLGHVQIGPYFDRKLAESFGLPLDSAWTLVADEHPEYPSWRLKHPRWETCTWDPQTGKGSLWWGRRRQIDIPAIPGLVGIPCDAAHVPHARRAMVVAQFGVKL